MIGSRIRGLAALVMAGAFTGDVHAAPQQLLNKSVTVSFSIAIPSRGEDGSTHFARWRGIG